jgi:uncharacterized membrane protein
MFAAIGDTPYGIMMVLHILAVMAAFAPAFVHPILGGQLRSDGDSGYRSVMTRVAGNGRRIYAPALIVAGVLGFGLSGMSDGVYALSQGWLIASIVVWIAMNGVLHALIIPGERAVGAGDDAGQRRMDLGGAAISVLLLVMLYLMVFKPGL